MKTSPVNKLLFHPAVTVTAIAGVIATVATSWAALTPQFAELVGSIASIRIHDVCLVIAPLCGAIAGMGRSPIHAVDNEKPPPGNGGGEAWKPLASAGGADHSIPPPAIAA